MYTPGAKVRMIRDQVFGNPEGGRLRVTANQWVSVRYVYYPGELHEHRDGLVETWSFWSVGNIDAAYIFRASDIVELALPKGAPDVPTALEFLITRQGGPA
jgi:hypothetical protein